MPVSHALPGQPIDVRPLGAQLLTSKSHSFFKSEDLEVMRLVLLSGTSLPRHKVPGEITIHCIEGDLDITLDSGNVHLQAGRMLFLGPDASHALHANADSCALVTIALKTPTKTL